MKAYLAAGLVAAVLAGGAAAQEAPKPGPEHDHLKRMVGTWDTVMTAGGQESKGTATFKMEVGGHWLVSTFEGELFGQKFHGKGLDSYNAVKKNYVSVWVDSMSGYPTVMEGTLDQAKKSLTMTGEEGPGTDGKSGKYKSVTTMPDGDTMHFKMFPGDAKQPAFTVTYKSQEVGAG